MTFRRSVSSFSFILALLSSARAKANFDASAKFDISLGMALGGPVGLLIEPNLPNRSESFTTFFHSRLRSPGITPLVLEANMATYGLGVNLLIDVFHYKRLRVHVLDLGIFWNTFASLSARQVRRSWDVTFGAGLEIELTKNWRATLDWRVFLPNPAQLVGDYGDFARPIFTEVVVGGQTWFGFSHAWAW